jgi:raffinose/stachyose/melibiose transport system substrate-binding protein
MKAMAQIKKAKIQPLANGGGNGPLLEQLWGSFAPNFYGGTGYYNDVLFGRKTFTDKRFVDSIEAVRSLTPFMGRNYMGVTYDASRANFWSGKAAFFFGGTFEIGYFRNNNPDLDFAYMPAPPLKKGGRANVATWADGSYAINATTPHKAEALKFLNFLASKDFGQPFTTALAQASAVPGTVTYDVTLRGVLAATRNAPTPYLFLVGFRYEAPTGSTLMQNGLQQVIAGQKTSAQLAAEIQAGIGSWYLPQRGKS